MFANSDELLTYIKDEDVAMVDVRFCDLPGIMQHFTIPISFFDESVFEDGLAFDGSSIRGFQEIHESDMLLIPDPGTAFIDPYYTRPTLSLICSVADPVLGEPYARDPRFVAQKAERVGKDKAKGEDPALNNPKKVPHDGHRHNQPK